jgi:chromosome segregation ATPase
MIKKALMGVVGLGLATVFLFGRDASSYISTTYHRFTNRVTENVPVEFQIDRARQMVQALDPEIRNSMHVIANEEVAIDQLNKQIDGSEDKAGKEKADILRLQSDLGQNKSVYQYASRTYSVSEVKQDLARRFSRFKVSDDTLAQMKSMRDARQKNLDAAHEKLAAMINARRKLDTDVENLEAKRKLVEVAQASSDYVFDDSQLSRAKELITDIRTKLEVQAKLANADVNVQAEIPLQDSAPADITDQVTQYFNLDGKHVAAGGDVAKQEVATQDATKVVPASYPTQN